MTTLITTLSLVLLIAWLALPVALLVLAGFANWTKNPLKLSYCWRLAEIGFCLLLATTAIIGAGLLLDRLAMDTGLPELGIRLGLYPDGLAVWMALMVSFIAWIILRYSRDYLRADPAFVRFLPWFLATVVSVLVLVFTDHLLVLAGAWVGVSLSLHQLLTLYAERPQARLAAAQKFIASRLGDTAILVSVLLIWNHYGSFRIPEIYSLGESLGRSSVSLTAASVLLAVAAALKCAQLPFHGWLIRVMEAPTPVSALLHAGVVNLGGFLWLRLFPVFEGFTAGHMILLVVGGSTALVAVFTMMTQNSAKHGLVWSTNAQMGFMLFEIALGAYTLALLHLLAHSLYKAHSFLAVGRTVKVSRIAFSEHISRAQVGLALAASALAAALLWQAPQLVAHKPVLAALLVFAVGAAVLGTPGASQRGARIIVLLLSVALVPLYGVLNWLLSAALPQGAGVILPAAATGFAWALLATLFGLSLILFARPQGCFAHNLHSHFSEGLYLDKPFEKLTRRWAQTWLNAHGQPADLRLRHRVLTGEKS
ncbi:NADH-quinone oxidoreductase subunit L [Marinobacter sp. VGCF2001]|uniref:NADH-quinone oxidoreductase subunit L n=1 Tax=Marinobacter sp. VGCF2001 TaxID=3417189 RepID=UPI003CEAB2C7